MRAAGVFDRELELLEVALHNPDGLSVRYSGVRPLIHNLERVSLHRAIARVGRRPNVHKQCARTDDRLVRAALNLGDVPTGGQRELQRADDMVRLSHTYVLGDRPVGVGGGRREGCDVVGGLELLRRVCSRRRGQQGQGQRR